MEPVKMTETSEKIRASTPAGLSPYYIMGIPIIAFMAIVGTIGLVGTILYELFFK